MEGVTPQLSCGVGPLLHASEPGKTPNLQGGNWTSSDSGVRVSKTLRAATQQDNEHGESVCTLK